MEEKLNAIQVEQRASDILDGKNTPLSDEFYWDTNPAPNFNIMSHMTEVQLAYAATYSNEARVAVLRELERRN